LPLTSILSQGFLDKKGFFIRLLIPEHFLKDMDNDDMVRQLVRNGSLKHSLVINAFHLIDRINFCVPEYKVYAYQDRALPLIEDQTISQPTTVAMMTEALELTPGKKVLEVGTGCGYQAAILAEIVGREGKVVTIEIKPKLVELAKKNLSGYKNIKIICGDGSGGLPKEAPFDGIIVTAAAPEVPRKLVEQLKVGGLLVIPVGPREVQRIVIVKKTAHGYEEKDIGPFVFVPLVGKEGWKG
jgi:protein-L-isoaspartate(D-aspartate) O-methyltransferase